MNTARSQFTLNIVLFTCLLLVLPFHNTLAQTIRWIPVVYHSINNPNAEIYPITDMSQVTSNINMMNAAYNDSLQLEDRQGNSVPGIDTRVRFFVANCDIDGNPLTGGWINETTELLQIDPSHDNELQQIADFQSLTQFPTDKYLNIFVFPVIVGADGWCKPDGPLDAALVKYLGTTRTTAHETGHWLGLQHPTKPDEYKYDIYNIMFYGSLSKACMLRQDQVDIIESWLQNRRAPVVHFTQPFANRVWVSGGTGSDLGSTLTVYGQHFTSTDAAKVPKDRQFPGKTDNQKIGSRQHLQWNGNRERFKMLRQINYGGQQPPSEETAEFADISPVTVNVSVEGISMDGSIDVLDPWYVEYEPTAYQPDNNWKTYPTGFKASTMRYGGVFIDQGDPVTWRMPYYSLRAQNQTLTLGGYSSICNFQNWRSSNATVHDSLSATTGVIFQQNASVLACFKARMRTIAPSLTNAQNQRRVAATSYGGWYCVYESMGDIWLSLSPDNGASWGAETRLNILQGHAANPSISNVLVSGSTPFVVISWIEQNGSTTELHLQSMRFWDGSFGWSPNVSPRSPENHRLLSDIYPVYPLCIPTSNARPVLQLESSGNDKILTVAFESAAGGIFAGAFQITSDLGSITGLLQDGHIPSISSNGSDSNPVIISYPSAYGYSARKYIYYLAGGYAPGRRLAQHHWATGSTSLITGGYSDYTYTSLQGGVNPSAASFALVTEGVENGGNPFVNYYVKETYLGNSPPRLVTNFPLMQKPTIMVENNSNFGSPTCEFEMVSGGTWYKSTGSSPTSWGTGVEGVLTRDAVGAGDRRRVLCMSNAVLPRLATYSGTGNLPKSEGELPTDMRLVRGWEDTKQVEHVAVLDFSGATVESVDSLDVGQALCGVRILSPSTDNTVIRQPDSSAVPLEVGLLREGSVLTFSRASAWTRLTTASLTGFRPGDVLLARMPEIVKRTRSYKVISLRSTGFTKESQKESKGDVLIPHGTDFASYPNPFNPATNLSFVLANVSEVKLTVHDVLGREVAKLAEGLYQAGYHSVMWNAQNVASGLYIAKLTVTDSFRNAVISKTAKLLLTK